MALELLAFGLVRAQVAAALAALLVLAIRGVVRRRCGAEAAWRLWAAAPAAAAASVFPGLAGLGRSNMWTAAGGLGPALAGDLILVWAVGVAATIAWQVLLETGFRRAAARGQAGPAVIGVLWPRVVTPADHALRFSPEERALILAHERTHIVRGDPMANLFIAAARALGWCNPLAPLATRLARLDQEIACDAAVLASRPGARRRYAETLLKAHLGPHRGVAACAWRDRSPVEARLRALARPGPRPTLRTAVALNALIIGVALTVWTIAPESGLASEHAAGGRPASVLFVDLTPPGAGAVRR